MIKQRGIPRLATEVRTDDFEQYYDFLIVPHRNAPVIKLVGDQNVLTPMRFSLLPSWSKEPKVKFATHNARLETIDSKPTWRTVFVKRHCIVPMTDFIEPIYEGDLAGNMVAFHQRDHEWIYAAGVYDEWVNKETGEVIPSFSIITNDPPPFIEGVGHDRCPIFLTESGASDWLGNEGEKASVLKEFLVSHNSVPDLAVEKHRPMRPGWEKRK